MLGVSSTEASNCSVCPLCYVKAGFCLLPPFWIGVYNHMENKHGHTQYSLDRLPGSILCLSVHICSSYQNFLIYTPLPWNVWVWTPERLDTNRCHPKVWLQVCYSSFLIVSLCLIGDEVPVTFPSLTSMPCNTLLVTFQTPHFQVFHLNLVCFQFWFWKYIKNWNYLKEQKDQEKIKMRNDKLFQKEGKETDGSFGKKSFLSTPLIPNKTV